MKKISIERLARVIDAEICHWGDGYISGVEIDSRKVKRGDCFFAIKGENFDGHNFIDAAMANGAACAVAEKDIKNEKVMRVKSTVKALGQLANYYRRECGFKVVAITGSVGKTTTRMMVAHVLSGFYRVHQSPANFNNDIGVPLTILSASAEDEIIVAELGTSGPGEIGRLSMIAEPDVAVVTNICPVHLEGLGSLEAIEAEKLSIERGLSSDGVFIKAYEDGGLADNVRFGRCGTEFDIGDMPVKLPLAGRGNFENALAAWRICSVFGISEKQFADRLKSFEPVAMRAEIIEMKNVTIINDCYNASPVSMENGLEMLAGLGDGEARRKVFICGGMAELGVEAERYHAELAEKICDAGVGLVITVGRLANVTADRLKAKVNSTIEKKSFTDISDCCNNLAKLVKDNDIILVKGSRIAKLDLAVEKLRTIFK